MQNRRDFLKMGIVGSAFLPTFANLIAKADQKAPVGQGKPREINIGIVGFGTMGKIFSGYLARCEGVRVRCVCDIWFAQAESRSGEATLNAPADRVFASMVAAFGAIRSAARRETVYFKPSDFTP